MIRPTPPRWGAPHWRKPLHNRLPPSRRHHTSWCGGRDRQTVDSAWRSSVGRLDPDSRQVRTRIFGGLPTDQKPHDGAVVRLTATPTTMTRRAGPPDNTHRQRANTVRAAPEHNSLLLTNRNGSSAPSICRSTAPTLGEEVSEALARRRIDRGTGASALSAAGAGRTLTQTTEIAAPKAGARSVDTEHEHTDSHGVAAPQRGSASVCGERKSRGRAHLCVNKMRNVLPGAPRGQFAAHRPLS